MSKQTPQQKASVVFNVFGAQASQYAVQSTHDTAAVRAALPPSTRKAFDALSPVEQCGALMVDDMTAIAIFRADGEAFESSKNRFFLSCVALFLKLGDESARLAVRDTWADSKHKSREYALKVFRLCAAAIEAGKHAEVCKVTGFARLAELVPAKTKEPADSAPAPGVGLGMGTIDGARVDPEQAARAERATEATSRAADIAAQLATMQRIADALSAAHAGAASIDADALAQWAADLNTARASLESLTA